MVHPERFERPTLWFVAKCSIQLSYGCILLTDNLVRLPDFCIESKRRRLGCWSSFGRWGNGIEDDAVEYVNPGTAQQLMDNRLREPGGIVFNADSLFEFAKVDAPNAINLAQARERKCRRFGRSLPVPKNHINSRHTLSLAAAEAYSFAR
jgi:hypothetical protein